MAVPEIESWIPRRFEIDHVGPTGNNYIIEIEFQI